MNKNLDKLLNDVVCEVMLYDVNGEESFHSETYKISVTEELFKKINFAISLKNQNPELREISLELDRNIPYCILKDSAGDVNYSEHAMSERISGSIPESYVWGPQMESNVKTDLISIGFQRRSIFATLQFASLRGLFYVEESIANPIKPENNLRNEFEKMNIELVKWNK